MARKVQIKLTDGSAYIAHQSVVAKAAELSIDDPPKASEIASAVWNRIESYTSDDGPLILLAENGNASVARLNPDNVVGVFVYDDDGDEIA